MNDFEWTRIDEPAKWLVGTPREKGKEKDHGRTGRAIKDDLEVLGYVVGRSWKTGNGQRQWRRCIALMCRPAREELRIKVHTCRFQGHLTSAVLDLQTLLHSFAGRNPKQQSWNYEKTFGKSSHLMFTMLSDITRSTNNVADHQTFNWSPRIPNTHTDNCT